MATNKNTIQIYRDWKEIFQFLSDEDAGKLIKHLLSYVNDENPEEPTGIIGMAWIPIKSQLKRDLKKWEAICERNRGNGVKGGRPKKPTGLSGLSEKPKKADKDKDKDKDINSITKVILSSDTLNDFISYLNNKTKRSFKIVNKKTQTQLRARLKEGYTLDDIKSSIDNAVSNDWHKENGFQYLTPEFFTRSSTIDKWGNKAKQSLRDKYKLGSIT